MLFSPETSRGSTPELIPHGTLHFASVNLKGMGVSQKSGGRYAKLELVLIDGPYQGRRITTPLMDPSDNLNKNESKPIDGAKMGMTSLTRMLEASKLIDFNNRESYHAMNGKSFTDIIAALQGQRVAVRIKVSKSDNGYDDRNEISEFISPAPASGTSGNWNKLISGAGVPASAHPGPSAGSFGAPSAGFIQPPRQSVTSQNWVPNPAAQAPAQAPAQASGRPAWVDEAPKQNPFG